MTKDNTSWLIRFYDLNCMAEILLVWSDLNSLFYDRRWFKLGSISPGIAK